MVLGELELCLWNTILYYVADHHQGTSTKGQEALITWRRMHWKAWKPHVTIASVAALIGCTFQQLNKLNWTIHLLLLPPASIEAEIPSLHGNLFHPELLL